jgi:hypothetical protein
VPEEPTGDRPSTDELPPLAVPPDDGAEQILLLVKQRLELLHRRLTGGR